LTQIKNVPADPDFPTPLSNKHGVPPPRPLLTTNRDLFSRPKDDLTEAELAELEDFEFRNGPLSVIQAAVQNHDQVLISLRNNRKLLARVKGFDRHCNMVLINVKEVGLFVMC
jgi:small nuclear ribonucleoprotein D2